MRSSVAAQHALPSRERAAWAQHVRDLAAFAESTPLDEGALVRSAADLLETFAGAPSLVYRPVRHGRGFKLAMWADRNLPPTFRDDLGTLIGAQPKDLFLYDPTRPHPRDRNQVRSIQPAENTQNASVMARFFVAKNMDRLVQTRMLVCSGPFLLAWAGVLREGSPADHARDAWLVRSLGRALRGPLRLVRRLPPLGGGALFETALEALHGEAFVVRRGGYIEGANSRATRSLMSGFQATTSELEGALTAYSVGAPTPGLEIHPVRDGARELHIVHRMPRGRPQHDDASGEFEARLHLAATTWRTTPREVDVLRYLVLGDAAKEIALKVGLHEGSVERHTTSILRKATCDSRARLIAKFWSMR